MKRAIITFSATQVSSIKEAIDLGYSQVIAKRDHYRGNSKGEIYINLVNHSDVAINHFNMDDRGIYELLATNEDVAAMVIQRQRILNLMLQVEHSMTTYSRLYKGFDRRYSGHKMVFGNWRSIYKIVEINPGAGALNFDPATFFNRHNKMLAFLKVKLQATNIVSSTYAIIN